MCQSEVEGEGGKIICEASLPDRQGNQPRPTQSVDRTFFDARSVTILQDSSEFDWDGLYIAVTQERPSEVRRDPLQAIWLAASLSQCSLRRSIRGSEYYDPAIPPQVLMTLTPPDEVAWDVIEAEGRALHAFISLPTVHEVLAELSGGSAHAIELDHAFSIADPLSIPILLALKAALNDPPREGMLKVDYLTRALVADILRRHTVDRRVVEERHGAPALTPRQLQMLQEYIKDNLSTDISIGGLAKLIGLSRTQFLRRFKASIGASPHQYVMEMRVHLARELLTTSSLSLEEIADSSGFANQRHLATVFSRFTKMSPSAFRRQFL